MINIRGKIKLFMKPLAEQYIITNTNELNIHDVYWTKTLRFRTFTEARDAAIDLSQHAPVPALAAMGLTEILLNAIEHGNLGIDYNEKASFASPDLWLEEVNRRLMQKDNINKYVECIAEATPSMIKFTVTDQGCGFNWHDYKSVDKIHRMNKNGRGILIAYELGFDELNYVDPGNKVECIIYRPSHLPRTFCNKFA